MDAVLSGIASALGAIMDVCYSITKNYGLAIILFTLISKLILLPISIWVHYNGIKMARMMPKINWLHVNHYGDRDAIAEGQAKLYKEEKYSPLAGLVPIAVQLILLLGLVQVIRDLIGKGNADDLIFLGINLGWVPIEKGGISLIVPVLAALSALIMTVTQNRDQALQAEQGKLNKYSMLIISVGLSLYLGLFVSAGVGLYWIASNLFSVVQMYLLNRAIPPEKYVDYDELEKSRAALAEIEALDGGKKKIAQLLVDDGVYEGNAETLEGILTVSGVYVDIDSDGDDTEIVVCFTADSGDGYMRPVSVELYGDQFEITDTGE